MVGEKKLLSRWELPSTTRSLPMALIRARENIMKPIRNMLAESGITEQQWRILRVLAEQGPGDATQIAAKACLQLPSQTRIVRNLLARGLVTQAQDPRDRRRKMIAITPAGSIIIADNFTRAEAIAECCAKALGQEQLDRLLDLLIELETVSFSD